MDIQRASVKFFLENSEGLDLDALIPVFHGWIRDGRIEDQLLIDVADYRHVPGGPLLMLVGHEAHYVIDAEDGELGLLYNARRDEIGPAPERLRDAFVHAVRACRLLESEPSFKGVHFSTSRLLVRVVSRLAAPNRDETMEAFRADLESFLGEVFPGQTCSLRRVEDDPRGPFRVDVRVEGTAPALHELAARLS